MYKLSHHWGFNHQAENGVNQTVYTSVSPISNKLLKKKTAYITIDFNISFDIYMIYVLKDGVTKKKKKKKKLNKTPNVCVLEKARNHLTRIPFKKKQKKSKGQNLFQN